MNAPHGISTTASPDMPPAMAAGAFRQRPPEKIHEAAIRAFEDSMDGDATLFVDRYRDVDDPNWEHTCDELIDQCAELLHGLDIDQPDVQQFLRGAWDRGIDYALWFGERGDKGEDDAAFFEMQCGHVVCVELFDWLIDKPLRMDA